ncbi:DNA-protecting protein DprA [Hoyosella sp. G463]|uniref:DNA-protecting protein DprA n=1 Tax=Lolliginicoccus lacisalsi TaxID=2742202 RepID=A0A927JA99_9ACTN|nr:DNA-processing protein DprA [Lolliginicoccus lacisalsi]MBD8505499.1 DNA-protecting protein DprA [Lolliginicoccus lacisalsi]
MPTPSLPPAPRATILPAATTTRTAERSWAYLSRVAEGPCWALHELISLVGPIDAARALRAGKLPAALDKPTRARRDTDTSGADLEALASHGGTLLTPDSPRWPAWHTLQMQNEPAQRDGGAAPPIALWIRGQDDLDTLLGRGIAIIGTRAPTAYGEHCTRDIAHELAAHGATIVSGAAYGIDGCAHRAALAAHQPTIAVLACGIDQHYPAGHARLLHDIARHGAIVSEYPPGTRPARFRFLARNRLIAAFAEHVIITEAGARSGARNTARWARLYNTPVHAMPGPVSSAASVGCHEMIRNGEATLLTRASDITGTPMLPVNAGSSSRAPEVVRQTDHLTPEQLRVFDVLPLRGRAGAARVGIDAGLDPRSTRAALAVLEMHGHARCLDGEWQRASPRSATRSTAQ